MKMKKRILSTLTLLALTSSLDASGWKIMPILDANHDSDFALALTGAFNNIKDADDAKAIYGVEASFSCPLLSPPTNTIRQQLNITNYSDDGLDIFNVSINPHYMIEVAPSTTIGAGPSIGFSNIEFDDEKDTVFTYGLGASLRSDINKNFFLGAEVRYELVQETDFHNDLDLDNTKIMIKLGYQF